MELDHAPQLLEKLQTIVIKTKKEQQTLYQRQHALEQGLKSIRDAKVITLPEDCQSWDFFKWNEYLEFVVAELKNTARTALRESKQIGRNGC